MSSSQNEHTMGKDGGAQKRTKANKGEGEKTRAS